MPSETSLKELLAVIRSTTGPSDKLDNLISIAFADVSFGSGSVSRSLDACLALMAEVLPGWMRDVCERDYEFTVSIFSERDRPANIGKWATRKSEPLALLDCILQALLSQDQSDARPIT